MAWYRTDSLFARLLLLQVVLAITLLAALGAFIYVDRNVAMARWAAQRWAQDLRHAGGWSATVPDQTPPLLRSVELPQKARKSVLVKLPRLTALADELRLLGVPLLDLAVERRGAGSILWLQVRQANGSVMWFGLTDKVLLPWASGDMLWALVLIGLLPTALSWVFMRRLMRPLDALRTRIQTHRPGEREAPRSPIQNATAEIKAIDAAYTALLNRFEQHEQERALMLAGVSHDMRSPLARIRLAVALLPDEPQSTRWREAIVRNTQLADQLVESFLDYVRAGELTLDKEADLAVLARNVAELAGRSAQDLHVQAPPSLRLRQTHPLLLERMMVNLLDNAFQHGQPPVELRVEVQGASAIVAVSDAGSGLPPEQRDTLLQAFARGDAARSKAGAGLGLAIVARVLRRMDGTLTFDQRDGRHVVRLAIPLHD